MDKPNEIQIIETPFFVVDTFKRSLSERLFSWPWRPWVKTRKVNTPSMVRIGDHIYCHPDLKSTVQNMVELRKDGKDSCCDCAWTWNSATSNGMCEFCEKRQWF